MNQHPTLWKSGSGTAAGLPCDKYSGHRKIPYTIWKTPAIKTDPKCAEIMARLVGIFYPVHMNEIPLVYHLTSPSQEAKFKAMHEKAKNDFALYERTTDFRSGEREVLKTLSAEHQQLPKDTFDIPQNYRRASEITQVTFSNNMKRGLKDLTQLGFRSEIEKAYSGKVLQKAVLGE